jgi:glycosyltransferase involved in cell wall biosynthesis
LASDFEVKASVIPNGLDIGRFRNAASFDHTQPYLLTVGRLEQYKGIQHVIRVLPEFPEYHLLVAGSGPYRTELEQLTTEVGVENRVMFLGYVDDDLLPQLYAGAEVYVSLSRFEAYGMTVPEALASGTPCVVLEKGALNDWISNRGVVGVRTTSPGSVRNAIFTAINDEIGKIEFPTWGEVTSELEVLYHE